MSKRAMFARILISANFQMTTAVGRVGLTYPARDGGDDLHVLRLSKIEEHKRAHQAYETALEKRK